MRSLLKLLVSGGLLAILLSAIDWQVAFNSLANLKPLYFLMAFAILLLQFPISAWKWQISLSIHGLSWQLGILIRVGVIGYFVNNFLPTSIGGDIYKAYRTAPSDGQKSRAISAILLDRVVGLLAMILTATIGAVFIYIRQPDTKYLLLILVFMSPLLFVALLPQLFRVPIVQRFLKSCSASPKFELLVLNGKLILGQPQKLWYLAYASIIFQFLAVAAIFLLFSSVGVHGVFAESSVIGATSALVSLLPISINGIGVMEGSFALTAKEFEIDLESAVLVSLILRLSVIFFSIVGAGAFFLDKGRAAETAAVKASKSRAD